MKKLLTLAMLCASAIAVNAQTEKGKVILGGTIGYSESKNENLLYNSTQTNLDLLPTAGYFVRDNLALGLGAGYSRYSLEQKSAESDFYNVKTTTDYFMVSPFVRHYVNISEKFKFFSQLSVPMKWGNSKVVPKEGVADDTNTFKSKNTSIGVSIEPGLAYFPTKKIGIQLSVNGLSYVWNKRVNKMNNSLDKGDKDNAFNLGTNFLAPRIGIQFHF
ncbi:PorT family protein [Pedobacter sp. PAMC26386]|nr:PorT family protein [Pedobacter sp. PAMC26386]